MNSTWSKGGGYAIELISVLTWRQLRGKAKNIHWEMGKEYD
jgi:hypothetical protein